MNLYDTLPRTAVEPISLATAADRRHFDQQRLDAELEHRNVTAGRAVAAVLTYLGRRLAAWRQS